MWKNVHSVYGAGIRTHDLWNMSLFPLPLDQGSRPTVAFFCYLGKENKSGSSKHYAPYVVILDPLFGAHLRVFAVMLFA